MNLATVRTALTRNKRGLMIAGAAAVGALALLARKKAGGDTPVAGAAASGSSTSPTSGSTSAGGYTTYAPYDSSGSDVYGAIQPQLEELRDMFGQIPSAVGEAVAGALPAPAPTPTPTPGPEPPPAPAPVDTTPAWLSSARSDPRRAAIVSFYESFLGRTPSLNEVNFQDASGLPVDQLRTNIVGSKEAALVR